MRAFGEASKSRATLAVMTNARDLAARLADLLRHEHAAMADFLSALADFDRRRLWVDLGYSGLFMFLHRKLGLSKGASYYRKVAAELVQRVPEILEPLRDGRLCVTSIVELAKVLAPPAATDARSAVPGEPEAAVQLANPRDANYPSEPRVRMPQPQPRET